MRGVKLPAYFTTLPAPFAPQVWYRSGTMIIAFQSVWRFWPAALLATTGILLLVGVGCATPAPGGGGLDSGYIQPDYAATVNALALSRALPTLTPTPSPLPPTDTPAPTATLAPTPTASPTPTSSPTATTAPQPTYTPRPRPTYTPRPLPNQNQGGGITAAERSPGLFFRATLVDGSEFDMEETLGTPTLLAFWAHW